MCWESGLGFVKLGFVCTGSAGIWAGVERGQNPQNRFSHGVGSQCAFYAPDGPMSCTNTSCLLDNTRPWRGNHLRKCPRHLSAEVLPCPRPIALSLAPTCRPPHSPAEGNHNQNQCSLASLKSPWGECSAPRSFSSSSTLFFWQVWLGRARGG